MADVIKERKVRVAFQPLNYMKEYIAEPMELMIDYGNGSGYVKSQDGLNNIEILGTAAISPVVNEKINEILDGVSEDGNTLRKLRELITPIYEWMELNKTEGEDSIVSTIQDIINKFKDMPETHQDIILQIMNKVDKVEGKTLSSNDLTNTLLDRLNSIQPEANNYIHPTTKVCNFTPIQTVNGKTGKLTLSKLDIAGLEGVEKDANYYIHPISKQCGYIFPVQTVNNMTGDVKIYKSDVGLGRIYNYGLASIEDLNIGTSTEKYVGINNSIEAIEKFIEDNNIELPQPELAWTALNSMILGRRRVGLVGTTSASIACGGSNYNSTSLNSTEKFNGIAWSSSVYMNIAKYDGSYCGTQNSVLALQLDKAEMFNGATWKIISDYPITTDFTSALIGIVNTALSFGGAVTAADGHLTRIGNTFTFNSLTWATANNATMIIPTYNHSGCGIQTSALSIGGSTEDYSKTCERFNSYSWSIAPFTSNLIHNSTGVGLQNSAIIIGGYSSGISGYYKQVERFNGISWRQEVDLPNGKADLGGCGNSYNAMCAGGVQVYTGTSNTVYKLS